MKTKTVSKNSKAKGGPSAAPCSAGDDPRSVFLSELPTDVLFPLLEELVTPFEIGCSGNFFKLGVDSRFRSTEPEELFDLIAATLKKRVPNAKTHPPDGLQ